MNELESLYQEVVLDHGRRPRNHGPLEGATHAAEGHNPLCGDRIELRLSVDEAEGVVREARFEGQGCAISTASASLMTELLRGLPVERARQRAAAFRARVTGAADEPPEGSLGKLEALAGVRAFPTRVKCALLAWHTLIAALERRSEVASTE